MVHESNEIFADKKGLESKNFLTQSSWLSLEVVFLKYGTEPSSISSNDIIFLDVIGKTFLAYRYLLGGKNAIASIVWTTL